MIEVAISKIKVDELQDEQIIYLKEKEGSRTLPVVIGVPEVNAIKMKLSGFEMPRPLTHDLLVSTIHALKSRLKRVLIDRLEDNTFFAKLVLEAKDKADILVDARPSDSIALAIRDNAPIFVEESVLEIAGISPVGGN